MRLAHISDFHFTKLTINPLRLLSKRIIGHLNWLIYRKKDFSFKQTESLPSLFRSLGVDLILLGGDFTSTSMHEEFAMAAELVQKFAKPWIAVPGNHDQYTLRSYRQQHFYQYFTNPSPAVYRLATDGLEGHKIAPKWWVLSLDTSRPTHLATSNGLFSKPMEEKLEHLLNVIPKEEKVILFNHYPFFQQEEKKRSLERSDALEKLIRNHPNIVLYLHGHTHRHSIADLQSNELPITLDSGSCCVTQGGSWNLIDLHEKGCSITPYSWNNQWENKKTQEFLWKR